MSKKRGNDLRNVEREEAARPETITETVSEPTFVCGVPDHFGLGDSLCGWPDHAVSWALMEALPVLGEQRQRELKTAVFAHIAENCGIVPSEAAQAVKARVLVYTRPIDGSGRVLAESELPCGQVTQCRQWFDTSEAWSGAWPWDGKGIPYYLTDLHETMHALGLPHAPSGVKAVMAPFLDTTLTGLQPWDIAELQKRYGKPTPQPPSGGFPLDKALIYQLLLLALKGAEAYAKTTSTQLDDIVVAALKRLVELLAGGAPLGVAMDRVKAELNIT